MQYQAIILNQKNTFASTISSFPNPKVLEKISPHRWNISEQGGIFEGERILTEGFCPGEREL